MGRFVDLSGMKFGRLTVLSRVSQVGDRRIKWNCKCDCGNEVIAIGENLKRGNTTSCGCYQREIAASMHTKHGHRRRNTHNRLYDIWCNMKKRCYNPSCKEYRLYGAEGKTICDDWLNDFQAFYDWSMSNGYKEDLEIDRIDGTRGYSPENCRWATPKEQANNTRRNRHITYEGKKQTMKQWSEETGIPYSAIIHRIQRGWSVKKVLETPLKNK